MTNTLAFHITVLSMLLFAGVALNRFSRYLKMPILICFLGVGILCGPHCLGLIKDLDMQAVQTYGEIAICFIMFSGGLQTSFKSIRSVFTTGTILANGGVVLTALIMAVFLFWMDRLELFPAKVSFAEALMVAATFSSTDAAAVFAILRGQKTAISPKLQGLLEYESGSNDPAAFLLTSVMISIVLSHQAFDAAGISLHIVSGIVLGLGLGSAIGFAVGLFGQWFYNWIHSFLEYNGLRLVAAVAIVFFCYGVSDFCTQANPLMACYVAGITMGNMRFNFKHTFIKFHDGISWMMQLMLFTALGNFFDYRMLFDFRNMTGTLLTSIFLMFIARPLVVLICMIRSPFTMRERLFTGWVGLRGSAPIMLAATVAAAVSPKAPDFGSNIFYGVFTLVLLSILFQGSSLMWVAKKLGLTMPYQEQEEELLEYDERPDGRELCHFTVSARSVFLGKNLKEIHELVIQTLTGSGVTEMPVMLMIRRAGKIIQPQIDDELASGDSLTFLGKQDAMKQMHLHFFPEEDYSALKTLQQFWSSVKNRFRKFCGK